MCGENSENKIWKTAIYFAWPNAAFHSNNKIAYSNLFIQNSEKCKILLFLDFVFVYFIVLIDIFNVNIDE